MPRIVAINMATNSGRLAAYNLLIQKEKNYCDTLDSTLFIMSLDHGLMLA